MTPLRYSEITPELHGALRILAALEPAYPQCGDKASRTLSGYDAWRKRQGSRTPQADKTGPGRNT